MADRQSKKRDKAPDDHLRSSRYKAEELTRIFEQTPYPVEICSADGTAMFVNQAFLDMMGLPAADLVVGKYNVFADPIVEARGLIDDIKRAYAGEVVVLPEVVMDLEEVEKGYEGTKRAKIVHEVVMYPIKDEKSALRQVVTIWHDVTERKKAEDTVERQRRELLSIFDNTDEVIYLADPDTHEIVYANRASIDMWGDIIGKKCYRALQGLKKPCSFCSNRHIFGKNLGKTYVWDFKNKRNDHWYHCIDRAIHWPDGRMLRYEMAIDFTDRKEAEDALRASDRRHTDVLNSIPDAIHLIDKSFTIEMMNRHFVDWCQEFGLPTDPVGRNLFEFFPFLGAQVKKEYIGVFETGKIFDSAEEQELGGRRKSVV